MSKSVQFQVFFGGLANIYRYLILLVVRVWFLSDPDTDITTLIKGLGKTEIVIGTWSMMEYACFLLSTVSNELTGWQGGQILVFLFSTVHEKNCSVH